MNEPLQSLQGAWQIESLEIAGAPVGAAGRIIVDNNHFTSTGMGAEYSGRLELTNPNKITLHFETAPKPATPITASTKSPQPAGAFA